MNWYVKYEQTGKIDGPLTKEKALAFAEGGDGMAFSEQIFESQFVTSEDVENLLSDLRETRTKPVRYDIDQLCKRAVDVITLLSAEKVIECSIQGGVFSVESEMPHGVKLEVLDYDVENYDLDDLIEDESGTACKILEFQKR